MLTILKNTIRIQNFKKIIKTDENEIVVLMDRNVKIAGSNFKVIYFEKDEIIIKGEVKLITYYE